MTGPEHYREAERLLAMCVDSDGNPPPRHAPELTHYIELAQVHATLADTAAIAISTVSEWFEMEDDATAWCRAIQAPRKPDLPEEASNA